jgi:tetratricopeptide (TPR) repeat protein
MRLKALFLLVSLAAFPAAEGQTAAQTRAFADSLWAAGKLSDALPVYQRAAFFMRPVIDAVILGRIADCFSAEGNLERALEYYDHSFFTHTDDSLKKEVLFHKCASYLRSKNYQFALMELYSLEDSLTPYFERERNLYLGMTWFGLEDFDKAAASFDKAAENQAQKEMVGKLFAERKKFYRPNPKLASWLSVFLPGSGQIYSGEIFSGINSILLTGFFMGLGVYIGIVNSPIDAIFTALPWFQRYYEGGFRRAADFAVHKRTENRNRIFNEVLTAIGE